MLFRFMDLDTALFALSAALAVFVITRMYSAMARLKHFAPHKNRVRRMLRQYYLFQAAFLALWLLGWAAFGELGYGGFVIIFIPALVVAFAYLQSVREYEQEYAESVRANP